MTLDQVLDAARDMKVGQKRHFLVTERVTRPKLSFLEVALFLSSPIRRIFDIEAQGNSITLSVVSTWVPRRLWIDEEFA